MPGHKTKDLEVFLVVPGKSPEFAEAKCCPNPKPIVGKYDFFYSSVISFSSKFCCSDLSQIVGMKGLFYGSFNGSC